MMTNKAREQIANAIWEEVDEGTFEYSVNSDKVVDAMADKVLAALPSILEGVIKPLEFWRSDTGDLCCDTDFGRYQIQKGGARYCCMYAMGMRHRTEPMDPPTFHRTEKAAILAANAHHRAKALRPFNLSAIGVET